MANPDVQDPAAGEAVPVSVRLTEQQVELLERIRADRNEGTLEALLAKLVHEARDSNRRTER